jgi:hypothetical protein
MHDSCDITWPDQRKKARHLVVFTFAVMIVAIWHLLHRVEWNPWCRNHEVVYVKVTQQQDSPLTSSDVEAG